MRLTYSSLVAASLLALSGLAANDAQAAKGTGNSGKSEPGVVYKWRDARGVNHYSDLIPNGVRYERRTFSAPTISLPPPPAMMATSPLCDAATANLALLEKPGDVVVAQPNGTLATLTVEERASRLDAAKRQQVQYCAALPPIPPPANDAPLPPPAALPPAPIAID